ncbi:hypothetical protein BACFIN_05686 [Bacteroides finegoldii DSM 17565]|nr:hypothetical protein BACFIN_05686 [Bacteroides finegoldii DSM 17565]
MIWVDNTDDSGTNGLETIGKWAFDRYPMAELISHSTKFQ